jgi:hypothetical protein
MPADDFRNRRLLLPEPIRGTRPSGEPPPSPSPLTGTPVGHIGPSMRSALAKFQPAGQTMAGRSYVTLIPALAPTFAGRAQTGAGGFPRHCPQAARGASCGRRHLRFDPLHGACSHAERRRDLADLDVALLQCLADRGLGRRGDGRRKAASTGQIGSPLLMTQPTASLVISGCAASSAFMRSGARSQHVARFGIGS